MSGLWRRCGACPHLAHCLCRSHLRRQCHPGRRSAGCPCWGSRQTWRTGRTDALRPGSPDHSLFSPARRDTWWILGVQEGRTDRRIAREQERRKKNKQSRAVEHYWQEVKDIQWSCSKCTLRVAAMQVTDRIRTTRPLQTNKRTESLLHIYITYCRM